MLISLFQRRPRRNSFERGQVGAAVSETARVSIVIAETFYCAETTAWFALEARTFMMMLYAANTSAT
jgi:hypothetical protein